MLRIAFFIFFISSYCFAQNIVSGTINPISSAYENVIVYQLKGPNQLYVNYGAIDKNEGSFSVEMPSTAISGMYRLMYDFENNGSIDFLYNKKSIQLSFDPASPVESANFINSEENKILSKYLKESAKKMHSLDSLQLAYFNLEDGNLVQKTKKQYIEKYWEYLKSQSEFEKESEANIANNFIKSYKKEYSEIPINTPQEYLNFIENHYFKNIDFNDKTVLNSSFFSERVIEYVFYLNSSDDVSVQSVLFKNAINKVMQLIENPIAKNDVLVALLYTFSNQENFQMLDYCIENYYNKLPVELIRKKVIDDVQSKVRLAIGKPAPDFSFVKEKEHIKLSDLDGAKKYILVFWSTECSHCLKEVPELYEYIKDNKDVEVIAISLEKDELGFNHHTVKFSKWTNVLALEKWENPIARKYEINSTPSYFVLGSNKTIVSKPDYFKDLKIYFENLKM